MKKFTFSDQKKKSGLYCKKNKKGKQTYFYGIESLFLFECYICVISSLVA